MAIFANLVGRLSLDSTAFDRNSRRAGQSMRSMQRQSLNLQRGMIQLAGAYYTVTRATRLLIGITKEAAQFSLGMARIHTMLDEGSSRYLPQYRREIEAMALEFGESTDAMHDATYSILSASIDASKAMKVLRASVIASRGGFTSTAVATKAAVGILNAYKMSVEDVTYVQDVLAATVKRGQITYEELAQYMGTVTAAAAILNVDLEALTATISTMTRAGIPVDQAFTAMRNILAKFKNPTDAARKAARELGFALDETSIAGQGLLNIFERLQRANAEQLEALMPSIRGFTGFSAALRDAAGVAYDYNYNLNAAGRSQETYNKVAGEAKIEMDRLSESWKALKRSFAEGLNIADHLDGITQSVQHLIPVMKVLGFVISQQIPTANLKNLMEAHERAVKQRRPTIAEQVRQDRQAQRRRPPIQTTPPPPISDLLKTDEWKQNLKDVWEENKKAAEKASMDIAAAYRRMFMDLDDRTRTSWRIRGGLLWEEYQEYLRVLDKKELATQWYLERLRKLAYQEAQILGGPLEAAVAKIHEMAEELQTTGELFASLTEYGLQGLTDGLADAVLKTRNLGDAMREVGMEMASMAMRWAMQQAVFGGLSAITGGPWALAGIKHGGGTVGGIGPRRLVEPRAFVGAQRYHNGGEVPAILQTGERVQSRQEVRSGIRDNARMVALLERIAAKDSAPTVVVVQSEEQILNVLQSRAGEEAIARASDRML